MAGRHLLRREAESSSKVKIFQEKSQHPVYPWRRCWTRTR